MTLLSQNLAFYTDKISCSLICEKDREDYCHLYTDSKIMRKIASPLTKVQAETQFQRALKFNESLKIAKPPRFLSWGIFDKNGHFFGAQGLSWNPEEKNKVEMGIMLNQQAGGKGLAVEGIGSLIDSSVKHLNVNHFYAYFGTTNKAVEKFVLKLGFKVEDKPIERQNQLMKYCYIDSEMWEKSPTPVVARVNTNRKEAINGI